MIIESITAYSIAVGPSSSRTNFPNREKSLRNMGMASPERKSAFLATNRDGGSQNIAETYYPTFGIVKRTASEVAKMARFAAA
jgi:hypothetical protein